MTDSTLNRFLASGTAAQRIAFTPSAPTPASGPNYLYQWYETDTGFTYVSPNGGAWVRITDGLPWKLNCRAATTGTLAANTYNNGTSGVGATLTANANGALAAQDGVTLAAGDRLLVKNEATGANNGIYTVTQLGSAGTPYILTRATDADSGAELVNAVVKLSEGTTLADTEYQCTTNATITVGSTSLTFAAVSTGAAFTAASTTEQLTGTDSAKGSTPDSIAALWEQGADVASAGTVSLGEGGYFNITGTTTITDIDFATDKAGRKAWVKFAGALTLTHNASTLILPTGANITTAAGDTACFVSEGSDVVRCVSYNRASGAPLASAVTSYEAGPITAPTTADLATWDNQGTSTVTDGTGAMILTPQNGNSPRGRYKTAPATPYTLYCRVSFQAFTSTTDATSYNMSAGIMFKDTGGDSERLYFGFQKSHTVSGGDDMKLYNALIQRWSGASPPVFSATPVAQYGFEPWPWMKVNNDGTTLTFSVSPDGKNWVQVGTETLAAYIDGAASYGVFSILSVADSGVAMFSYFSTTAPA